MTIDYKKLTDKELAELLAQQTVKLPFLYSQKTSYEAMMDLKQEIKNLEQEIKARKEAWDKEKN